MKEKSEIAVDTRKESMQVGDVLSARSDQRAEQTQFQGVRPHLLFQRNARSPVRGGGFFRFPA